MILFCLFFNLIIYHTTDKMREEALYSEQELQKKYENDSWSYVGRMTRTFGSFDEGESNFSLYNFINQLYVETVPAIYGEIYEGHSWTELILSKKVFNFQLIKDTGEKMFEVDTIERKVRFSKDMNYHFTNKALGRILNGEDNEVTNTFSKEYFEEFLDQLRYDIEYNL